MGISLIPLRGRLRSLAFKETFPRKINENNRKESEMGVRRETHYSSFSSWLLLQT